MDKVSCISRENSKSFKNPAGSVWRFSLWSWSRTNTVTNCVRLFNIKQSQEWNKAMPIDSAFHILFAPLLFLLIPSCWESYFSEPLFSRSVFVHKCMAGSSHPTFGQGQNTGGSRTIRTSKTEWNKFTFWIKHPCTINTAEMGMWFWKFFGLTPTSN